MRTTPVAIIAAFEANQNDLGRTAADVKDQSVRDARIEQRGTAGDDKPRLLSGRDDFDVEPGLTAHPGKKLMAIGRPATRFRGDIAAASDPAEGNLVGADLQGLDRALDGLFRQGAGGQQPLAEANDARESIDDANGHARAARHQQPAIVGAEIESGDGCGIARADLPMRLTVAD